MEQAKDPAVSPEIDVATPATAATAAPPCDIVVNVVPPAAAAGAGHDGWLETLGANAMWPLVALILATLFRRELAGFMGGQSRIKSIGFAGFSLELADIQPAPMFVPGANVDIRHAGTENEVDDSTLASFYTQIQSRDPMQYAIVDLGKGSEWLTSRLYVLAVIMKRMRGLRVVVFLADRDNREKQFVGSVEVESLRWRLATWFPWLEYAVVLGEQRAWGGAAPVAAGAAQGSQRLDNDHGRFQSSEPAADLLRGFLAAIQQPLAPAETAAQWQYLPASAIHEHAEWLTVDLLQRLLGLLLENDPVELRDFEQADEAQRARLVVNTRGSWLAVTRNGQLYGLIDRQAALEKIARQAIKAA